MKFMSSIKLYLKKNDLVLFAILVWELILPPPPFFVVTYMFLILEQHIKCDLMFFL